MGVQNRIYISHLQSLELEIQRGLWFTVPEYILKPTYPSPMRDNTGDILHSVKTFSRDIKKLELRNYQCFCPPPACTHTHTHARTPL